MRIADGLQGGVLLALLACSDPPETVIFVVLDTVRADRVSACGHTVTTTPNLDALSGSLSCTAIAPGGWTLPSHASFMTGTMPSEHRAHCLTSGVGDLSDTGARSRPLNDALPTVAERFAERGFQTVAVSGNPVVSEKMGLMRGFDVVDVSPSWGRYFGEEMPKRVDEAMAQVDPSVSTFLFVNIADAHQPWSRTGDVSGLSWNKKEDDEVWARYLRAELPPEEWGPLKTRIDVLYDAALQRADASLGAILETHCGERCRVVITADHGELLGEHQLLDHGHNVWDENAVVPLFSSTGTLPEGWISALDATEILLGTGKTHAPMAESWPHVRRCARSHGAAFCDIEVGLWGQTKQVWSDGVSFTEVDGVRTETSDAPLAGRGAKLRLEARDDGQIDFEVEELLRAAGYMD